VSPSSPSATSAGAAGSHGDHRFQRKEAEKLLADKRDLFDVALVDGRHGTARQVSICCRTIRQTCERFASIILQLDSQALHPRSASQRLRHR